MKEYAGNSSDNSDRPQSPFPFWVVWISCLSLGLGGMVSRLQLPIEGRISGLRLAVCSPWFGSGLPGVPLLSFGGLSLVTGLLALFMGLSPWRHRPVPWLALGLWVWLLVLLFLMQLANHLDDLTFLWDQRLQYSTVFSFAQNHCGAHFGLPILENFPELDLQLHGLLERLRFNCNFLSWGLILVPLAGGLILYVGFSLLAANRRGRWTLLLALVLVAFAFLISWGPVVRDRQLHRASDAISCGQYREAQQLLDHLGRHYPDLWGWPPFPYLLGEANYHLGQDTPARHFYLGAELLLKLDTFSKSKQVREADLARLRLQWSLAATSPEPRLKRLAQHLLAWAFINDGLKKFKSHQPAAALDSWEQAMSLSARQLQALLYLAKARVDLRLGRDCLPDLEVFLSRCQARPLLSTALTLAGNAHYQLGNFQESRSYYERSMYVYHYINFPAHKGLSGQ